MDSCFVLIRTHQHGIAGGPLHDHMYSVELVLKSVYAHTLAVKGTLKRLSGSDNYAMLMSPNKDETKQLSMAETAR